MKRQIILPEYTSDLNEHIKTDWVYSKDKDMDDVIDSVDESDIFKNVWYVDNPISEHSYYVFAKRCYDDNDDGEVDSKDDDWIGPFEVFPLELDNSYLMIESHVELPIEKAKPYINDDNELVISLYGISPDIVRHLDTTYILDRITGENILTDIHNQTELTERKISLDGYDIDEYEDLILRIAFRNEHKICSEFAVFGVDSYKDGVNIKNDLTEMRSELDNILVIDNPDDLEYSIAISDSKGLNIFRLDNIHDTELRIPKYTMSPETLYNIRILVGTRITYDKNFKTSSYNIYNNGHLTTYSMRLDVGDFDILTDINKVYTEPINLNTMFTYNKEYNTLSFLLFKLGMLFYFDTYLDIDEDLDTDYISFIHMDDDKIAMTGINTDGKIVIYVLRVNVIHYSVVIDKKLIYDDFDYTNIALGRICYDAYLNNLYILGNVDGNVSLISINMFSYDKRVISDIPNQEHKDYFIGFVDYNNLLISMADTDDNDEYGPMYLYNVTDESYNVIDTFPEEFKESNLVTIPLPNNRLLFLDSDGYNEDYLIFDNETQTYEIKPKDSDYVYGSKVFLTSQGEIFVHQHDTEKTYNYFN